MFKSVFTNLVVLFVLPLSAFASNPLCAEYNEFVSKQCVSAKLLKGDMNPEMLRGYSIKGCRNDAFKTILEYDVFADSVCKPVMNGKLISALK